MWGENMVKERTVYLLFLTEGIFGAAMAIYGQYANLHPFLFAGGALSGLAAGAAISRFIFFGMFRPLPKGKR